MSLAYVTVQYVPDPLRGEGRNVAVIGTADGRGYVRAVGLSDSGEIDLAEIRAFAGLSFREGAALPDWLDYFVCVSQHNATSRYALLDELSTLSATKGPFVLGSEGIAEMARRESPEAVMDRVFDRLVGHLPSDRIDRFPEQLEHFLHHTELRTLPDFHQDPEIELETTDGSIKLRFHMALVDSPAVGFRIVRYSGEQRKIAPTLKEALREFKRAQDAGFLDAKRSVILTDRVWPAGQLAKRLADSAVTVIDVFSAEASIQLYDLLQDRHLHRR